MVGILVLFDAWRAIKRLQRVNEQRLLSHLRIELKALLPDEQASLVAHGIASLIDGIWLRGTLNPEGIDAEKREKSSMTTSINSSLFTINLHFKLHH